MSADVPFDAFPFHLKNNVKMSSIEQLNVNQDDRGRSRLLLPLL